MKSSPARNAKKGETKGGKPPFVIVREHTYKPFVYKNKCSMSQASDMQKSFFLLTRHNALLHINAANMMKHIQNNEEKRKNKIRSANGQ